MRGHRSVRELFCGGMLDVRMYRKLKKTVDGAEPHRRQRLVNVYAGAFVVASLIALVIT